MNVVLPARSAQVVLLCLLVSFLSACAPRVISREALGLAQVILNFKSDKPGPYRIGEALTFGFELAQGGHITALTQDSDGKIYELERNSALSAGQHLLPAVGANYRFEVDLPLGLQRVWLVYSDVPGEGALRGPTSNTNIGASTEELEARLKVFLRNARVRDVAEVAFEVLQ